MVVENMTSGFKKLELKWKDFADIIKVTNQQKKTFP